MRSFGKLIGLFAFILIFSGVSFAGETYFRVGPSLSFDQSHDISINGNDLNVSADNPGFGYGAALGYKPHARNESGFFGEIESGYSKSNGDVSIPVRGWESQSEYQVETRMDFVHLFFNFGYEQALKYAVIDGKPIKVSAYVGAGPVFSEVHADSESGRVGGTQLDNILGDIALGWQTGADVWIPVLSDLELGVGGKWVDRGLHRTIPGVKYENNSVDGQIQARFWF